MADKSFWSPWIPYPSSWISALLLGLLSIGVFVVMWQAFNINIEVYANDESLNLEPLIAGMIYTILLPIPLIAIFHHYLHKVIGRWFSSIQAPEVGETKGLFPGLMSWWEGFFSWAILWISTLVSVQAIIITRPILLLSWGQLLDPNHLWSFDYGRMNAVALVSWLLTAAYLYQLQHLIEQRLLRSRLAEFQPSPSKKSPRV